MQQGPPRRRPARPVGDAPIDPLLLRVEDLAKGWLLAILEQTPLEAAPSVLGADLARDGPRICEAIVRALRDEEDLRRLEAGGLLEQLVSRTGELAGATTAEASSAAVDALAAVTWSALRSELVASDAEQVAELAARLAFVMELVRAATLRRFGEGFRPRGAMGPVRTTGSAVASGGLSEALAGGGPSEAAARGGPSEAAAGGGPSEPVAGAASGSASRPGVAPPEIPDREPTIHPSGALWIGAVEDEIARAREMDVPLALLLVELEEAERVAAAELAPDASATFGRFAQALRSVVRRKDILACETDSRAWIIARDTGRLGAQSLAGRAATAVREAQPWRGAPMTVSAGVAVLNEDGRDAAGLIEAAEEAKFAAAAAGVAVIDELPPDGGSGPRLVS